MLLLLSFLLVPSKVRELTVMKGAAGSLAYSLTWEPPASPNGIIRFYKVCTIYVWLAIPYVLCTAQLLWQAENIYTDILYIHRHIVCNIRI